jgi:glycosyltransferase involved in cell wall biosynthesis
MRVAYVGREVPHYRIPLFRELGKRCTFTACGQRFDAARLGRAGIEVLRIGGWFPGGRDSYIGWLRDQEVLCRLDVDVILHEFSVTMLSNYALPRFARRGDKALLWWGHGRPRRPLYRAPEYTRAVLTRWLVSRGGGFVAYSEQGRRYLAQSTGMTRGLFVAPNTVDSPELRDGLRSVAALGGREGVRESLDAVGTPHIALLSRLIPEKRVDVSLRAALATTYPGGVVHVIGDGPERMRLSGLVDPQERTRVRWWGEVTEPARLAMLLSACDLLMSAGSLGLAVVHAMFAGLPVVACRTSVGPWHGPEVESLEAAGGVSWCPSLEARDLATLTSGLLTRPDVLSGMGDRNRAYAFAHLSLERQVDALYDACVTRFEASRVTEGPDRHHAA